MGRHKKVIPKFKTAVVIQTMTETQHKTTHYGNLITAPFMVPGSPEDFNRAFENWFREYQKGPKRIRKPVTKNIVV